MTTKKHIISENSDTAPFNLYGCWLAGIDGIGKSTLKALYETASCAEEIYQMTEGELLSCLKSSLKRTSDAEKAVSLLMQAHKKRPEDIASELVQRSIHFVCSEDSAYPMRLRGIPDAPYALYYYGDLPSDNSPAVGIVGARNCSGYGREQARRFSESLSLRGIQIISGMARGIDGIAGRAAIAAGGRSYALLGSGVDICYPKENSELYGMLIDRGGVISEFTPGTRPKSGLFPLRNRLISGLSDAILVIEARRRSGSLITVDAALEQGREVFALPGRVSDSLSDGCNLLIRQGADIACSPENIMEFLFGVSPEFSDKSLQQELERNRKKEQLPPLERALFEALGYGDVMEFDFLLHRAETKLNRRISVTEAAVAMMQLQLKGLAAEIGICHYKGI